MLDIAHDIENPIYMYYLKVRLSIVVDSEILLIFESRRLKKNGIEDVLVTHMRSCLVFIMALRNIFFDVA